MSTMTLKPGLLVSLKTSITGGVQYTRKDLDAEQSAAPTEEAKVERWETTKIVTDPVEHEAAVKARGKCRSLIAGACSNSAFGLLCALADEEKLDAAITESRGLADKFNATHTSVQIDVFTIKGRIAETDTEATRAIAGEVKDLVEQMQAGIVEVDVKKIRDAANKARAIGKMLDEGAGKKVTAAIEEARKAAREIVKQIADGEDKTTVKLGEIKMQALDEARFAFLELEEAAPVVASGEALPSAVPKAVELDDEPEPCIDHGTPMPCAVCAESVPETEPEGGAMAAAPSDEV